MVGSQALIGYKGLNGLMVVDMYNVSSYGDIVRGRLDFDVTDIKGENSDGVMRIFAMVELPEKGQTTVNQVWQVGGSVSEGGVPARHEFQPGNLESKGSLDLLSGEISGGGGGGSKTKKRNVSIVHLFPYFLHFVLFFRCVEHPLVFSLGFYGF